MVERITHFRCSKCRREFSTYDEADTCEYQHIVDDALTGFREQLSNIFDGKRKHRASIIRSGE